MKFVEYFNIKMIEIHQKTKNSAVEVIKNPQINYLFEFSYTKCTTLFTCKYIISTYTLKQVGTYDTKISDC